MMRVIEQTTAERNEETERLFNAIRPLLDEGHSYHSAVKVVKNEKGEGVRYYSQRWFADLKEYGERNGYPYRKYSGRWR